MVYKTSAFFCTDLIMCITNPHLVFVFVVFTIRINQERYNVKKNGILEGGKSWMSGIGRTRGKWQTHYYTWENLSWRINEVGLTFEEVSGRNEGGGPREACLEGAGTGASILGDSVTLGPAWDHGCHGIRTRWCSKPLAELEETTSTGWNATLQVGSEWNKGSLWGF